MHTKAIYFLLGLAVVGGGIMFCKKNLADQCVINSHHLITADGDYSMPLQALIEKTGIVTDGSLSDLVAKTQLPQPDGGWMRPSNLERWELPHDHTLDTAWYLKQFRAIGFIDAVKPCKKRYTYAIIFGATIQGMRERFAYLLKLLMQNEIEVDYIIFLAGQRPRYAEKETELVLFSEFYPELPFDSTWQMPDIVPATETDLVYLIIAQTALPASLKESIIVIDAPMITKPDGTQIRPTTDSTVQTWLSTDPERGSILCISSQPHIERQWYVAQRLLPEWDIECVGPAADEESINIFMMLDTLARTLWELHLMQDSMGK